MNRALFLDRDGVINQEVGYLHRAEDVRWIDGILPLCRTAQTVGYKLIMVTNQAGIGRGLYTAQQFDDLMVWMRAELEQSGITLDAVYHCPFHPEATIAEYKRDHADRKPAPGMLLRGAAEFALDLSQCILIGDRCSDIAAANAAGLRKAFLLAGTEPDPCPGEYSLIHALAEAETWITANS